MHLIISSCAVETCNLSVLYFAQSHWLKILCCRSDIIYGSLRPVPLITGLIQHDRSASTASTAGRTSAVQVRKPNHSVTLPPQLHNLDGH